MQYSHSPSWQPVTRHDTSDEEISYQPDPRYDQQHAQNFQSDGQYYTQQDYPHNSGRRTSPSLYDAALWDPAAASYTSRTRSPAPLTPYIGLRARQCLSLLSPTLLSLAFVLVRVLINAGELDDRIALAKAALMNDCRALEGAMAVFSNWPHVAAQGINERAAHAVEETVRAAGTVLLLSITAIDQILLYIIDTYRSLLLCFIELLVRGSLSLIMAAVSLLQEAIQAAASALSDAISASVSGINATLSGILGAANDALSLVGQHIDVPQIAQPDLGSLNNVQLPESFTQGLTQLNSSLPTLDQLRKQMDAVISEPFDQLKTQVNTTVHNFSFSSSLLPVPAVRTTPVKICAALTAPTTPDGNGGLLSPLDDFGNDMRKFAWCAVGLLAALMLALAAAGAAWEAWKWRCLLRHVRRTREAYALAGPAGAQSEDAHGATRWAVTRSEKAPVSIEPLQSPLQSDATLLSLLCLSTHPLVNKISLSVLRRSGRIRSQRKVDAVRWYVAFLLERRMGLLLLIGVLGLLVTQLQIVALNAVKGHYADRMSTSATDMMDRVWGPVEADLQTASRAFVSDVNFAIGKKQSELDTELFAWVNTTTTVMNSTLVEFSDAVVDIVNTTFASTPLLDPVQNFIQCILLRKIQGIEQALTWIQENSHVTLPTIDDPDVLVPGQGAREDVQRVVTDQLVGASGNGGGDSAANLGLLDRIAGGYQKSLDRERWMFIAFLGIWLIAVVLALIVCVTHF